MEEFYCIACADIVTTRQEALLCGGCDRWQHRRCNTGITREAFRKAVRDGLEIAWLCLYCKDETAVPIAESTKPGKAILVDNLGYTYKLHHRRSYATYWQCTVRPKGNPCRASVTERDGTFQPGKNNHNNPAEVGTAVAAKIVTKVKAKAVQEKFRSVAATVDEVSVLTLI